MAFSQRILREARPEGPSDLSTGQRPVKENRSGSGYNTAKRKQKPPLRQKAVHAQPQVEQVLFVKSFLVTFCDDKKG
jgi:hypothetical protein